MHTCMDNCICIQNQDLWTNALFKVDMPHGLIPHISFDYLGGCRAGNSVQCVVDTQFNLVSLPWILSLDPSLPLSIPPAVSALSLLYISSTLPPNPSQSSSSICPHLIAFVQIDTVTLYLCLFPQSWYPLNFISQIISDLHRPCLYCCCAIKASISN